MGDHVQPGILAACEGITDFRWKLPDLVKIKGSESDMPEPDSFV